MVICGNEGTSPGSSSSVLPSSFRFLEDFGVPLEILKEDASDPETLCWAIAAGLGEDWTS